MKTLRNLFYGVPVGLLMIAGWCLAMLVIGIDWVGQKLRLTMEKLEEEWKR